MMQELNSRYRFVLGSKSPRRSDLLEQLGLLFVIRSSDFDEVINDSISIEQMSEYLAEQKAESLRHTLHEKELLITADTLVISGDKILGKPSDEKEAFEMIKSLSGKWHKVTTGMCLLTKDKKHTFSETTEVLFKDLSDLEISYYIDNYKTLDKAGAYGIQEWIGLIGVKEIKGCFFNVIGLPVPRFYEELKEFSEDYAGRLTAEK